MSLRVSIEIAYRCGELALVVGVRDDESNDEDFLPLSELLERMMLKPVEDETPPAG